MKNEQNITEQNSGKVKLQLRFSAVKKLFPTSFSYRYDKNGSLRRKYKTLKILGLKFTSRVLPIKGDNNHIILIDSENKTTHKHHNFINGLEIYVDGNNNTIILPTSCINEEIFINCSLVIQGDNNLVEITNPQVFTNTNFILQGNENKCKINNPKYIHNTQFHITESGIKERFNNRTIEINSGFSCNGCNFTALGNNTEIKIGKNCMFAFGIYVWTTDAHKIYDIKTKERINPDKSVKIGNHVWVGRNVSIHKGAEIPDDCMIGANSFVNKIYTKSSCIIAGNPSKIIKEGIYWER